MSHDLSFGCWLQQCRRALDLTQAELAHQVGCATVTIQKIELQERRPSKDIAERLAEVLSIAAEERAAFLRFARGESSTTVPALPTRTVPPVPPSDHERRPTNLPLSATPLIGREHEVAGVRALLTRPDVRVLTLTGTGGIGKTRLALAIAAELQDTFSDGVFFVTLAPISDPTLVLPAIAQALGITERGEHSLLDTLTAYVQRKHLLLLLDNFEQVVVAAPLVADVVAAAPALKVLVTSRVPLHISSEQEVPVPPLALPDHQQQQAGLAVAALGQVPAVALFVQRAQAVKPDFGLTAANAPVVAEICARLDGLPLAIELVAPRVKLLSPQALLARLGSRLNLLTGGKVDQDPRHRTLRATLDWSYQLLDAAEQQLFARLAVFVGGWTVEAAEAVCTADGAFPLEVLDGLAALLDKSLVQQVTGVSDDVRCTMLETIREYALEQLELSGETAAIQRAHATYYLALAEQAALALVGRQQVAWLARVEQEHANLRVALQWAVAHEEVELGLRLSGALGRFWCMHRHLSEGRQWLETTLARGRHAPAALRAKALLAAGMLADWQGDEGRNGHAATFFEESLALFQQLGDTAGRSWALGWLGVVVRRHGDYARAAALLEESLILFQQVGDIRGRAWTLGWLGVVVRQQGDDARAATLLEESLILFQQVGDTWERAWTLWRLGVVVREQGDYGRAAILFEESLALFQQLGDTWSIATALRGLGLVARHQGDYGRAVALLEESLALFQQVGDDGGRSWALGGLGELVYHQGDAGRARMFFEESLALFQQLGDTLGCSWMFRWLGALAREQGDYARATTLLEDSLALCQPLGDDDWSVCLRGRWADAPSRHSKSQLLKTPAIAQRLWSRSWTLYYLSWVAYDQGDRRRARQLLAEAAGLFRDLGIGEGSAALLEECARHAAVQAHAARAARLWGAAEVLRALGETQPMPPANRGRYERALATIRCQLDAATFTAAWAEGRAMTVEQAVAYAFATEDPAPTSVPEESPLGSEVAALTPREHAVAALVGRGLTNRQIAAQLGIARRTVDVHVSSILHKLGLTSRGQIADHVAHP